MTYSQGKTLAAGREELEDSYVRRTGRFLFFKTEWWERVSSRHIANDIVIKTTNPIRTVLVNGEEFVRPEKS